MISLSNDDLKKKHECSIICPSIEYLQNAEIITNVTCDECGETFSQISALNLHLEKVHRIFKNNEKEEILCTRAMSKSQKIKENCDCKYHCPKEGCKYNGERFLPTFHSLKNHFIRMHAAKSFKCVKCYKEFSIKSEMERHETNCGKLLKCTQCGVGYSTLAALHKHVKNKNHVQESINKNFVKNDINSKIPITKTKNFNKILPVQPVFILPSNLVNTPVILLPCNNDLNQNTNRSSACQTYNETMMSTQDVGSQTNYNLNQSFGIQFDSSVDIMHEINNCPEQGFKEAQRNSNQQNRNFNDYDCLDAATSTSPFLDLGELLLSNTSTQTQQSYFTNSCSIQTNEIVNDNSGYFCTDLGNLNDYFDYGQDGQDNGRCIDKTCQTNRCITPSNTIVSAFASSQTDDISFYNNYTSQQQANMNTQSIQTQTHDMNRDMSIITSNGNVVQTQTDLLF
ncbi:unnamed protein product [Brachionus calyciflorus]|uniref:C2H2-type domain-containing protein n=1 Tax=Brachionus calyciflorus TaxID=104777 RepID=A0A814LCI1_9BILA|nr:unnamed protein product [Brachionus calyciflorus]